MIAAPIKVLIMKPLSGAGLNLSRVSSATACPSSDPGPLGGAPSRKTSHNRHSSYPHDDTSHSGPLMHHGPLRTRDRTAPSVEARAAIGEAEERSRGRHASGADSGEIQL